MRTISETIRSVPFIACIKFDSVPVCSCDDASDFQCESVSSQVFSCVCLDSGKQCDRVCDCDYCDDELAALLALHIVTSVFFSDSISFFRFRFHQLISRLFNDHDCSMMRQLFTSHRSRGLTIFNSKKTLFIAIFIKCFFSRKSIHLSFANRHDYTARTITLL